MTNSPVLRHSDNSITIEDSEKIYFLDQDSKITILSEDKEYFNFLLYLEKYFSIQAKNMHVLDKQGRINRVSIDNKTLTINTIVVSPPVFKKQIANILEQKNEIDFPTDDADNDKGLILRYFDRISSILHLYRNYSTDHSVVSNHFLYDHTGTKIRDYGYIQTAYFSTINRRLEIIKTDNMPVPSLNPKHTFSKEEIEESYSVYTDYIDRVFKSGNVEKYKTVVLNYLAQIIFENRTAYPRLLALLGGDRGCGKSDILTAILDRIFTQDIYREFSFNAETEKYNNYLEWNYLTLDDYKFEAKLEELIYNEMKKSGSGSMRTVRKPGVNMIQVENKTYWNITTNDKNPIIIRDIPRTEETNQILAVWFENDLMQDQNKSDIFFEKHPDYKQELDDTIGNWLYYFLLPHYKKNNLKYHKSKTHYRFGLPVPITTWESSMVSSISDFETTTLIPTIIDVCTGQIELARRDESDMYDFHVSLLKDRGFITNYLLRLITQNSDSKYKMTLSGLSKKLISLGLIEDKSSKISTTSVNLGYKKGHQDRGFTFYYEKFADMVNKDNQNNIIECVDATPTEKAYISKRRRRG